MEKNKEKERLKQVGTFRPANCTKKKVIRHFETWHSQLIYRFVVLYVYQMTVTRELRFFFAFNFRPVIPSADEKRLQSACIVSLEYIFILAHSFDIHNKERGGGGGRKGGRGGGKGGRGGRKGRGGY